MLLSVTKQFRFNRSTTKVAKQFILNHTSLRMASSLSNHHYSINQKKYKFLKEKLNLEEVNNGSFDGENWFASSNEIYQSTSPINDKPIASVKLSTLNDYERCKQQTLSAWHIWADLPMPKRGDIVRQIGDKLRDNKRELGSLISLEMGKILQKAKAKSRNSLTFVIMRPACPG